MARFEVRGVDRMRKTLGRIAEESPQKIADALTEEAEAIMQRSKEEFVPVDSGDLRDSGRVNPPTFSGDEVEVTLSYGDAKTQSYALSVHEHPSPYSPPSWRNVRDDRGRFRTVQFNPPGRGPKYLERPLMDAVGGMMRRLSRKLRLK